MWIFTIGNRVEFHATGDTRIGCVYAGAVSTTPHRDFIHTHTNANRFVLLNLTLSRVRRYSTDTSTSRSCPHTHSLTTTRLHVRILTTSTQASNRRTIVGSSRVSSAGFCQWWISIKTKRIASNSRNRFCHFVLFFLFIYFVRSPVVKTRSKPKKKKEKGKISFQRILTVFIVSVVANKKSSQLVRTRFCMGLAWRCVQILYLGSRVLFSSLFFSPTIFLSLSLSLLLPTSACEEKPINLLKEKNAAKNRFGKHIDWRQPSEDNEILWILLPFEVAEIGRRNATMIK